MAKWYCIYQGCHLYFTYLMFNYVVNVDVIVNGFNGFQSKLLVWIDKLDDIVKYEIIK